MTSFARLIGTASAAAAFAALAAPVAAQYYPQQYPQSQQYPQQYPQTYPQQYPQQYPQTYPQGQAYPGQPYGYGQNPVADVIDQLLGNRYTVTDRDAIRHCANAARAQAAQQYGNFGGNYGGGYGQGYGQAYGQGYGLHVTSITNVERRPNGLRVAGTLGTRFANQYGGQYGNQYGNQYAGGYVGRQLSFRCYVAYNGAVTDIRIRPIY